MPKISLVFVTKEITFCGQCYNTDVMVEQESREPKEPVVSIKIKSSVDQASLRSFVEAKLSDPRQRYLGRNATDEQEASFKQLAFRLLTEGSVPVREITDAGFNPAEVLSRAHHWLSGYQLNNIRMKGNARLMHKAEMGYIPIDPNDLRKRLSRGSFGK